jgi:hypothetical protein
LTLLDEREKLNPYRLKVQRDIAIAQHANIDGTLLLSKRV